jgi:hypothetical protein
MLTQDKRLIGIILTVVIILLIPLIGMQFSNEVDWKVNDFVIMALSYSEQDCLRICIEKSEENTASHHSLRSLIRCSPSHLDGTGSGHFWFTVRWKLTQKLSCEFKTTIASAKYNFSFEYYLRSLVF